MTELIALQRESNASAGSAVRVAQLPMWIGPRSRAGTYWHIPRSAVDFGDRLAVSMWCGVSFHSIREELPLIDPPEGVKCGTCAGRFEGRHGLNGLVFTPRDDFALPRLCPSGDIDAAGCCVLCGARVRWWLDRPQRHAPAPLFTELVTPCPDHGWRDAYFRDDRLVCLAFVGGDFYRCDFVCGPRETRRAA